MKLRSLSIRTFALAIIPALIFVSKEGSFNVQSILVPIILLVLCTAYERKLKIEEIDITIIILYLLSMVFSGAFNVWFRSQALNTMYLIRMGYFVAILLFYICSVGVTLTKREIHIILDADLLTGVLLSLYFIFINKIQFTNLLGIQIDKNQSGSILAIQGLFALVCAFKSTRKYLKYLYSIAYLVILSGTFFSASRAAVLGIILGTLLIILESVIQEPKKRKWMLKAVTILVFVIAVGVVFVPKLIQFLSKQEDTKWFWDRYFVRSYVDRSNTSRISIWINALKQWLQRPIFGHGIGLISLSGNMSAVAHNTYLDALVDQGIIGGIALALVWLQSVKKIIRKKDYIFIGPALALFWVTMIISASRSTLLWYNLILFRLIGSAMDRNTGIATEQEETNRT